MRTTTGVLPVLLPARNSSAVHTFTDALEPSLPHANVRVVHSDTLLVWPRLSWATRLNGFDHSHADTSQLEPKIVLFLLASLVLICTLAVMWRCIVCLLEWYCDEANKKEAHPVATRNLSSRLFARRRS